MLLYAIIVKVNKWMFQNSLKIQVKGTMATYVRNFKKAVMFDDLIEKKSRFIG